MQLQEDPSTATIVIIEFQSKACKLFHMRAILMGNGIHLHRQTKGITLSKGVISWIRKLLLFSSMRLWEE